jgi:hypothetical protein
MAMTILEGLCRTLNSLTADIFYSALDEAHFSEEDKVRLVGACFRTAQACHWIERTTFSAKSRRNHSNLLSVWVSNIFGVDRQGQKIGQSEIEATYAKWRRLGLEPPDREAKLWRWQKEAMASWEQGSTGAIPGLAEN